MIPTTTAPRPLRLTYRDYAALDDGKRYELIDGDLIVAPSPGEAHQRESLELARLLANHVRRLRLGFVYEAPFDVVLSPHHTVQPDVIFVSTARRRIITPKNIRGAPDWVAEVVSPGRRRQDYRVKKRLYAQFSIPEYWIVDPERRIIEVHVLEGAAYRLDQRAPGRGRVKSRVVDGFAVQLKDLFAE